MKTATHRTPAETNTCIKERGGKNICINNDPKLDEKYLRSSTNSKKDKLPEIHI